jgi:hypothetical protein
MIEILPSGIGYLLSCTSPCARYYISPHTGWSLIISLITQSRYSSSIDEIASNV